MQLSPYSLNSQGAFLTTTLARPTGHRPIPRPTETDHRVVRIDSPTVDSSTGCPALDPNAHRRLACYPSPKKRSLGVTYCRIPPPPSSWTQKQGKAAASRTRATDANWASRCPRSPQPRKARARREGFARGLSAGGVLIAHRAAHNLSTRPGQTLRACCQSLSWGPRRPAGWLVASLRLLVEHRALRETSA